MVGRKLNILVYTGTGTTVESVRHCLYSLRRILSHAYAVNSLSEPSLLNDPWPATCALLILPGGADLGYCSALNGLGNRKITDFVRNGGAYLGFCAGGYYGSERCEFEVGREGMEVVGRRELGFFAGTCRGGAFAGFEYKNERGARAVRVRTRGITACPEEAWSYYNGGGVFVPKVQKGFSGYKYEVLASYEEDLNVDGGAEKAAVVLCHVGLGKAVLTGPHPEFAPANLHEQHDIPEYADLLALLTAHDASRCALLKGILTKLGLEVSDKDLPIPSLSPLYLSAMHPTEVTELLESFVDIMSISAQGETLIKSDMDIFRIEKAETKWDFFGTEEQEQTEVLGQDEKDFVNFSKVIKTIVPFEKEWPSNKEAPCFHHTVYYSALKRYRSMEGGGERKWGEQILYAEVITSTNTIIDKNLNLLAKLPTGFTITSTTQVAGRGRGNNVWVSPTGALIFSTVINHRADLAMNRPIVFIQYIAAIAIVEAIKSYDAGYEQLPVKLKWPNDLYALDPDPQEGVPTYVKIGGILATCSYNAATSSYQIVLGIGVSTANTRPTTCLNNLLPPSLPAFRIEILLPRILTRLETVYTQFLREGFSPDLEARYYRNWLHTGQLVTLEAEGCVQARILGITRDWGLLRAEEVGTGRLWSLQSDENSFDFWKGLIKRKM